jgi:4,5-DOPA dioxygenase extradiol
LNRPYPALFVGHGSPMQAIEHSRFSRAWRELGERLPRPRAILVISAHWYIEGTGVTAMPKPRTIHDFYGFPPALYECRYPAPGAPELAAQIKQLLSPTAVMLDHEWGLDHGAWSVLLHLFPAADVPVVQLSIDAMRASAGHYELGRRLGALRDEQVLILGSGNVVHNLRLLARGADAAIPAWASAYNDAVRAAVLRADHASLIDYAHLDDAAAQAVPTPEHYLPLLYVLGAQRPGEPCSLPIDGMDLGTISMLSVLIGDLPGHSTVQKQ